MNTEKVEVGWEFDLEELRRAIEQADTEGQKAAKKLIRNLKKEFDKAESAAARAAKAAEVQWREGLVAIKDSTETTLSLLGGPFGDLGDLVLDLGGKVTGVEGAIGAAGVAAGVGAVGVAALTTAVVAGAMAIDDYIGSADQALERLDRISGVEPLPADTIEALDDYRQASLGAEAAAAKLQVKTAAMLAEAFKPGADVLVGFLEALDDILPSAQTVRQEIEFLQLATRVAAGVFTLGATEAVRYALGLDELGEAGRAAAADLQDLDRIQEQLNAHMDAAKGIVQIQRDAILAATGASDAQQRLARDLDDLDETTQAYIDTLDLEDDAQRSLADAAYESTRIRKAQLVAAYDAAEAEKALTEAQRRTEKATREADRAARANVEALRAAGKVIEDLAKAQRELDAIAAEARSDTLSAEEQIDAAYRQRLARIDEIVAKTHDQDGAQRARDEAELRRRRELDDLAASRVDALEEERAAQAELNADLSELRAAVDELPGAWDLAGMAVQVWGEQLDQAVNGPAADAVFGLFDDLIDAQRRQHEEAVEQLQEELEQRREAIAEWAEQQRERVDHLVDLGRISRVEAAAERKRIGEEARARRQALNERKKGEKAAAMESWRRDVALQKAQAAIESVRAGISLIPAFSFAGPFAPALAAGVAAGALGLALAQIGRQKPPEFPTGRAPSPDHRNIVSLQDEEAVLSRRGVVSAGGAEGVARLNEGQRGGDGRKVVVQLGRRVLAEAWEDVNGRARPDGRAGRVDPWR